MESAVTLPGGGADKLGNRYEALWTVWQWLRLLSKETAEFWLESFEAERSPPASLHVEPFGEEGYKTEFVLTDAGRRHTHQVKLRGIGRWTLAGLEC